jgi:hypothetical protein
VASAQPAVPIIGFLSSRSGAESTDLVAAFRKGLGEAGYVEGQNIAVEYRWADGQYDRLPALVADPFSEEWRCWLRPVASLQHLPPKRQPPQSRLPSFGSDSISAKSAAGAVGALRGAEITQARERFGGKALQQRRREPRFADPGFARE